MLSVVVPVWLELRRMDGQLESCSCLFEGLYRHCHQGPMHDFMQGVCLKEWSN